MVKRLNPENIAIEILTYMRLVRKHVTETSPSTMAVSIIVNKRILLEFIGVDDIGDDDFNLILDNLGMNPDTELRKNSSAIMPDIDSIYTVTLKPKPLPIYVFDDLKYLKRYALATT